MSIGMPDSPRMENPYGLEPVFPFRTYKQPETTASDGWPSSSAAWGEYWGRYNNYNILKMTTIAFTLFVIFEIAGGLLSGSLALVEDAIAMSLDVVTYLLNIYAEGLKLSDTELSRREAFLVHTAIPLASVAALLALCLYFTLDAVEVLQHDQVEASADDSVEVGYMYFFSILNAIIDIICVWAFSSRGYKIFYDDERPSKGTSSAANAPPHSKASSGNGTEDTPLLLSGTTDLDSVQSMASDGFSNLTMAEEGSVSTEPADTTHRNPASGPPAHHFAKRNLVMITAASHVGGDTIRTISVLVAALVASITGINADVCDAWAAIVASVTIVVACGK